MLLCLVAGVALGQPGNHWVATWAASPQVPRVAPAAAAPVPPPVGAPGQLVAAQPPAITPVRPGFTNQTIRMIARASIGGRRVRVQFSNAFGTKPVEIGAAHIALREKDSEIVRGSDRTLLFNGKPAGTILVGATLLSDPVDLDVAPLADLAVSIFLPTDTGTATVHNLALHTTYVSAEGDSTGAASMADGGTRTSWYFLSAIDVMAPADAGAVVAFGDSITDGSSSTPETNRNWPSQLAARLIANPATAHVAVVNEGIGGNRVLADGAGVSALARFDRDVLGISGVKWLMLMEGINDIGSTARPPVPGPSVTVTADALIGAMRQMIERAHTHGIKVIGCTLTPYLGANYYSESGEAMRTALNTWIRTPGNFDAFVDFDAATRDPEHPLQFLPPNNNTDHLHPNDAGYKAMADSVKLTLFGK
jgi:lysophospholipase L1-like esterase